MTGRQHDPTRARLEGFEAALETVLDWISSHPREVLALLGVGLVVGLVWAGGYEWRERRDERAHAALAEVERRLARGLGADPGEIVYSEPANAEQALAARREALEGLERVIAEHGSSRAADEASLRAAEIELDLGRAPESIARLEALVAALDADDALRAVAGRLLSYAYESSGREPEAAQALERAAEVESYPDRALLLLQAGELYEKAGQNDRALAAYQRGMQVDAVLAEQLRVIQRIDALEARAPGQAPGSEGTAPPGAPEGAGAGGVGGGSTSDK